MMDQINTFLFSADIDSEDEDKILAYIDRRDNPHFYPESPDLKEEEESNASEDRKGEESEEESLEQSTEYHPPEKGDRKLVAHYLFVCHSSGHLRYLVSLHLIEK